MTKHVAMCHLIAEVIAADGIMHERERAYLEQTMDNFDLSGEEKDQVRNFKNEGTDEVAKAMSDADKNNLRDDLLAATLADGKISSLETDAVQRITTMLGI